MNDLSDVQIDFGPDTDWEIELKRQLAELQERYRQEAKPILDELTKIHAMKAPRLVMTIPKPSPPPTSESPPPAATARTRF